jgi:hypothetical protein
MAGDPTAANASNHHEDFRAGVVYPCNITA